MTTMLHVDQQRTEGTIGASDAAAALGLSQYKAPITLWRELRGIADKDEKPDYVNEAASWGQLLEPVVRGRYAYQAHRAVVVPRSSSVLDGWLRATPDGFVMPAAVGPAGTYDENDRPLSEDDGPEGLLQCKTASAYLREAWADGVPAAYEVQVRVEMAVTDLPWCDVVCLIGGQKFVGPFRVERDLAIEANILTDLQAFWRSVKDGREPAVDGSPAWVSIAAERFAKHKKKVWLVPSPEVRAEVDEWRRVRRAAKAMKAMSDEMKNKLLLRLADAGAIGVALDFDTKVTAYQTGAKPKWKEYCLSLGGTAKPPPQFMGTTNSWALRAPDDEDEH